MKCINCGNLGFKFIYKKNGYDILACEQCHLTCTKIPDALELDKIYDETYFEGGQKDGYGDYVKSEKTLRQEFRKTVLLLKDLMGEKKGLKLLEIGSAYGFFLDEAAAHFECTGIEVATKAVEFSKKRGHKTICGSVTAETLSTLEEFDVIVMLDVIEHLPDPSETISLLTGKLKKGGILLVVTGNIASPLAQLMKKRWRLMTPPQHTYFFSKETLVQLLEKNELIIKVADRPWKFVPLGLAFYQLSSRLGFVIKVSSKLNRIGVPINLFDTIRVIAKKQLSLLYLMLPEGMEDSLLFYSWIEL